MPRPKSKSELVTLSNDNFSRLMAPIMNMDSSEKEREFSRGTMNRNIRDVLAHLYHWHLMFMEWYNIGMAGKKPDMPAPGFTWKDTPKLNKWIWEHYSSMSTDEVIQLLNSSHTKIMKIVHSHTNDELFEKKKYKWTGTTSLGAYLISATSSHYDWAIKLIRKSKKTS